MAPPVVMRARGREKGRRKARVCMCVCGRVGVVRGEDKGERVWLEGCVGGRECGAWRRTVVSGEEM